MNSLRNLMRQTLLNGKPGLSVNGNVLGGMNNDEGDDNRFSP